MFYWCQQDEWEKVFKEQLESNFSVVKKKVWADQVKSFKSSNTYKSCPVSVRPKTPNINEINLDSKNNKVIFKALHDWRQNFSALLPREKKPIAEIAKEDLEKFKKSDLWKNYEKARLIVLVEKIKKPDYGHIKTLEEWAQYFNQWKANIQEMLMNVDPKGRLKHYTETVNAFKETLWYQNCKERPKTPDLNKNLYGKSMATTKKTTIENELDAWKKAICIQYPRSERPLELVKQMDSYDWSQSDVSKTYERATAVLNVPRINFSLNSKKCKTFEDWDKNFEDIKMKTREALNAIDMDELQKLECKKSKKDTEVTKAQKNIFRYHRADFRQSKAYMNTSYPRPPTPIFDDFADALEANKALTSWMESIYKKYPRSDWPVFICQDGDIGHFTKSELFKDYQKLRLQNLIEKKSIDRRRNFETIEDWDKYFLWYVKSLKEAVETANEVKKDNEKELSALKVALPEPVKLCSNISIGITLPKPCAIKRKSADGSNSNMKPVKKLKEHEESELKYSIKKEVKDEIS